MKRECIAIILESMWNAGIVETPLGNSHWMGNRPSGLDDCPTTQKFSLLDGDMVGAQQTGRQFIDGRTVLWEGTSLAMNFAIFIGIRQSPKF